MKPLHIAVLMGGWSAEREVSLTSGAGVAEALESRGHRVTRIDMGRDVAVKLAEAAPDVVFNALHGTPGEDGTVQGLMDLMGLKYTHSGLETSVIAIDKELTKMVLVPHGIRRRHRQGGRQSWRSDRAGGQGPVAGLPPPARRALHQGPGAYRRGAERRGPGGDRASAEIGLLRL